MRFTPVLHAVTIASLVALTGCALSSTGRQAALAPGSYAVVDAQPVPVPAIPMADPEDVGRVIQAGLTDNRVMDHLTVLTQEFGPRLTGSTRCEASEVWAVEQFRSWGLDAARLEHWGDIAARFDREPSTAVLHGPGGARRIDFTTLSWTTGTQGPVRGPIVRMPASVEEVDPAALRGAWVLIPDEADPQRRGIRSVGYMMRERLTLRHEVRRGITDPHTGQAQAVATEAPDGPHWAGTYDYGGSKIPTWLQVAGLDGGEVTGTLSIPGFHTGPISGATYDTDAKRLAFTWAHSMGESSITLAVDGERAAGESRSKSGNVYPIELAFNDGQGGEEDGLGDDERARREVLAGVLAAGPAGFISTSRDPDRVWTTAKNDWRTMDLQEYEQDVEVNIRSSDFEAIEAALDAGETIEAEVDLRHRLSPGPIACHNVVGEITGARWPDEAVIISAHLDSWDGPGSQGCIDNGTGVAVVMEAARLLAASGVRPARTIRFMLWTGEEQGLLGSKAYVDSLTPEQLDRISAMFVDDGGTNYQGGAPAADSMVPFLAAASAPINGRFFSPTDRDAALSDDDPANDALAGWLNVNIRATGDTIDTHTGSDHAPFNNAGVPGFFWDEIGRANYRWAWHTQHDKLDQAIPEYLHQSATNMAVVALQLADAPARLPRSQAELDRVLGTAEPAAPERGRSGSTSWMRVEPVR